MPRQGAFSFFAIDEERIFTSFETILAGLMSSRSLRFFIHTFLRRIIYLSNGQFVSLRDHVTKLDDNKTS